MGEGYRQTKTKNKMSCLDEAAAPIKKLKRGDVCLDTGRIFWAYYKHMPNGEYWVTPQVFTSKQRKTLDRGKKWRSDNSSKCKEYFRQRYKNNPEKVKASCKKWLDKNKDKALTNRRRYDKERKLKDPIYCLKKRLRCRTAKAFIRNGYPKESGTSDMLGCEWEVLKEHIESKFVAGMSWGNRNLWHIDHIVPLASANSLSQLIDLCHYSNLQPLWASENQIKGAKQNTQYNVI
jgi:hypothetical protein